MRNVLTLVAAIGLTSVVSGCSDSPSSPSQSGNLRVMITDAPFDDATALHVTFSEVKAHRADAVGGWISVPFAGTPAATWIIRRRLDASCAWVFREAAPKRAQSINKVKTIRRFIEFLFLLLANNL